MNVAVSAAGAHIFVGDTEIGWFEKIGRRDGEMVLTFRLDPNDAGQAALTAASVSEQPQNLHIQFKTGDRRIFGAIVRSCEMDAEDLIVVISIETGSIEKVAT